MTAGVPRDRSGRIGGDLAHRKSRCQSGAECVMCTPGHRCRCLSDCDDANRAGTEMIRIDGPCNSSARVDRFERCIERFEEDPDVTGG